MWTIDKRTNWELRILEKIGKKPAGKPKKHKRVAK